MGNKMEEISSQRKLEALEENGTFIRKDGKTFLQLDCENAKELLTLPGCCLNSNHLEKFQKFIF